MFAVREIDLMAARGRKGVFLTDGDYRSLFWSAVAGKRTLSCDRFSLVFEGTPFERWRTSRMVLLIALMGEAGLRVGECVGLKYETFRPALDSEGVVTLPRALTKSKRSRVCIVTRVLRYCALVHVDYARRLYGAGWEPSTLVTCRRDVPMSVRGAQASLVRAGHRYLGRAVWPHDLRRTFGDRCRRMGDVRLAQLELGHIRLETTQAYLDGSLAERVDLAARRAEDLWPAAAMLIGDRFNGGRTRAAVV